MQRIATWRRQFNWRMLLMRILINALALIITAGLVPNIYFIDRTIGSWLLLALVLGILNAFVKPVIQFLTLRFIFATYGLVVALINAILLLLLELLFPTRFAVNGLVFWPLVGGAVIGIVSAVLENLLGLTPPIVSEKYPDVRQRIKDRETGTVEAYITQTAIEKTLEPKRDQQPDASAAAPAVLAVVGAQDDRKLAPTDAEAAAELADPEQPTKPPAGQED